MEILSVDESRQNDAFTIKEEKIEGKDLVYRAAGALYEVLRSEYMPLYTKKICVICGKGNNGADGLALSFLFKKANVPVKIFLVADEKNLSQEANYYYNLLIHIKAEIFIVNHHSLPEAAKAMEDSDVIVDALLGTGLNREVTGLYKAVIEIINMQQADKISVDISSGLNGDNGQKMGCAVEADLTVVMQQYKYGNILNDADDYTKRKLVRDIQIHGSGKSNVTLLQRQDVLSVLHKQKKNVHKYQNGSILVLGGSKGMEGAMTLCAKAALRSGAGLVTIGVKKEGYPRLACLAPTESMVYELEEGVSEAILHKKSAMAIGMGMKKDKEDKAILQRVLQQNLPVVLDAGALSIVAENKEILKEKSGILTPHTAELATLLGCETQEVRNDPVAAVKKAAMVYKNVVVLKMNKTLIASPCGKVKIADKGNRGMATAGSGDVLGGIIVACINKTDTLFDAACAGVYLHALAGEYAMQKNGATYMNASDIVSNLSEALKELGQ